jgi:transposase, IS5 family
MAAAGSRGLAAPDQLESQAWLSNPELGPKFHTPVPSENVRTQQQVKVGRNGPTAQESYRAWDTAAKHGGDAINAVLAAAGYNFRRLLAWLRLLLLRILIVLSLPPSSNPSEIGFFTADCFRCPHGLGKL